MQRLVRLAIGTVQPEADLSYASTALMAAFEHAGLRVQNYWARACLSSDAAAVLTGQASRHLDSWLTEPEACHALFERGARNSDVALIQGAFDEQSPSLAGGSLNTLCNWLDLPRIAVVDASQMCDCRFPRMPNGVDALIVDGAQCCREQCKWQTCFESFWGVPVLGFLSDVPALRAEVSSLAGRAAISGDLRQAIAEEIISPQLLARILALALTTHNSPQHTSVPISALLPQAGMRIATAFDEAFHCYFPDALDQLEMLGAEIVDFSPLRDDRLPFDADLVYFGCGHPESFSTQLAQNCCMTSAIRRFIEGGGRVYAEGGGLAYLAEDIVLPDGTRLPMSGALPLRAVMQKPLENPEACEIALTNDCWLGEAGSSLRGYRNARWQFVPLESSVKLLDEGQSDALLAYQNALGSSLQLNFAMLPTALDRLFEPLIAGFAV